MSLGILQRKQREKIMERRKGQAGSIKLGKAEPNKQTSIKMMIGYKQNVVKIKSEHYYFFVMVQQTCKLELPLSYFFYYNAHA